MTKQNQRLYGILISTFFFLLLPLAYAEISYLDLKGVHEQIKPEYQIQLSPVFGYTLLGTGALKNRRFYGNYGISDRGYFCSNKNPKPGAVAALLKTRKDCPLDANSELIQRLFPSQDGVNLVANQIHFDPISHLQPKTMGKVLEAISQVNDADWNIQNKMSELTDKIKLLLFEDINPVRYKRYLKKKKQDLQSSLNSCKRDHKREIEDQIRAIETILGIDLDTESRNHALSEESEESISSSHSRSSGAPTEESRTQDVGKEKHFKAIAEMIVSALKESRISPQHYPKYLPEQALMAFLLKKANTKEDFIALFQGMPNALKHHDILQMGSHEQKAFLATRHQKSDYEQHKFELNPEKTAQELAEDPEKLIFSVMQDKLASSALPPIIGYGSAEHSSLAMETSEEMRTYPDCGETSLRNFFNIVTYDQKSGEFNAEILKKLNSHGNSVQPNLISFYERHKSPGEANLQEVADDWSENVVSKQVGVEYLKPSANPKCEMDAGIDNMMTLINQLLHQGVSSSPIAKATDRYSKINELCNTLERSGFELNWYAFELDSYGNRGKPVSKGGINTKFNTSVELEFEINEEPSFTWQFQPGHFAFQDLTEGKKSWRDNVGEKFAKSLMHRDAQSPKDPSPREVASEQKELLLPWFSSQKVLNQSHASHLSNPSHQHQSHLRENLIYSLPLSTYDGRLAGFKAIVSSSPDQAIAMKPFADRLRFKLPEETDLQMKQEIYAALADAGNPYEGETVHALGKPDAVYRRVHPDEIESKFGKEAAKQMGRTWERMMFGHPIAIGEPLLDQSGNERELYFESAKKACFDLNQPEEKKKAVMKAFEMREAAVMEVMHNVGMFEDDRQKKIAEIYQNNPIPGIYVMSRKEWEVLELDFGSRERKYVPQILPKIYQNEVFTSSKNPHVSSSVFTFNGHDGKVSISDIYAEYGHPVRCCAGPITDSFQTFLNRKSDPGTRKGS